MQGLVVQNPFQMGYLGVKTLVASLRGQKVALVIDTGCALVTRENMAAPAMADLLYPPLEKYLK
ncbi:MAG: ribose transport system substrate-binding protein [Verrucomicrobia bacterium]|nr:MAG: ribose transport system substrate-binding protein [Verrucomicrobiota bacterium]